MAGLPTDSCWGASDILPVKAPDLQSDADGNHSKQSPNITQIK